jgi:signal transduction histidine kinase
VTLNAVDADELDRASVTTERRALRLVQTFTVLTSIPLGIVAAFLARLEHTTSPWLLAELVALSLTIVLMVLFRSEPFRKQALVICVGSSFVACLALVHFGPTLGVGLMMANACIGWTFLFGVRGAFGAMAALIGCFTVAALAQIDGVLVMPEASAFVPDRPSSWLRLGLTLFGTLAFLCAVLHLVYREYKLQLCHVIEGRNRLETQRQELSRLLASETRARLEAEEATRLRDEFIALASHELRTPLTSLKLMTQMKDASSTFEPPRGLMDRQLRRLERLIESMLGATRLSSGELTIERRPIELVELARDVVEGFGPDLQRSGSEIVLTAPDPVVGDWDRAAIDQVLTSLVGNAIKFGAGKPIHVVVEADDESAFVVVTDHGIGIEPDALPQIFDRFHRAVSWMQYGGLGLGLHITQQIVALHGGLVKVVSAPNEGTTFTIVLPKHAPK